MARDRLKALLGVGFFVIAVLLADWAVTVYRLPLPAPVLAMAVLAIGLMAQRRVPATLEAGAVLLFRLFPLLFIPPLVAIVAVTDMVVRYWLILLFAISVSTLMGLAAAAFLFRTFRGKRP